MFVSNLYKLFITNQTSKFISRKEDDMQRKIIDDRTHEEINISEIRYRRLFETMAQGVIYYDATGKTIFANPSAERILGFSPG
jgi:PAS domain-containing protein